MSLFNATTPTDTDSAKNGASQIRGVKTLLNTLLSQIFAYDTTFLPKFVTNSLLAGDASDDSKRAVGSNNLKTDSVILRALPDGLFTADAPGRAKFATGFITGDLLAADIVLPDAVVTQAAIANNAVGTGEIIDLAVTLAKVGTGVAKIAMGTYAGSNSVSTTVTGLAFTPTFLILTGGKLLNRVGLAVKTEATSNIGPIHSLWGANSEGSTIVSPFATAITWTSNGFTVTPANNVFNDGTVTHTYLALAV